MVVYTCDPSTWESETGEFKFQVNEKPVSKKLKHISLLPSSPQKIESEKRLDCGWLS